ncbi:MAG TPA: response regulator [Geobacteraceae bacterium]|nr:response regulator [Geobacteraceae bacterium]
MATRIQMGNLLVEAGIISVKTLERALQLQKGSGKRLGTLLRDMGIVTEEEVLEALARQCNLRTVRNLAEQSFPKALLDLVPARLALEKLIFPLKQYQEMLAIATLDPFDQPTFDSLAGKTGMGIYLALATRDDIVAAIKKHYLVGRWAAGGKQKVLLIDPSPVVTQFLQTPLEREGYEVLLAQDGIEGLKLAFSHHPDLILCDLMMPRMDGYTFMHAVRTHPETTDIPLILLSAKISTEEEDHALKAGFTDFIGKPAMPIRVLVKIKKALATAGNMEQGTGQAAPPAMPKTASARGRSVY